MAKERKVSVSRTIKTSPDVIFDILADPAQHPEIDGSDTVKSLKSDSPERLSLGSKFGMKMKLGLPYDIRNTVVEFEENELIAWAHFGKHRWRYELEATDEGTLVTETFDWSTSLFPPAIELAGYPKRHVSSMEKTLERLDAAATSVA